MGRGTRYWFSASVEWKEWKPSRANVKERREERKIMAIAVLPSNDHASNVVRVIAGVYAAKAKPPYLSMSGS